MELQHQTQYICIFSWWQLLFSLNSFHSIFYSICINTNCITCDQTIARIKLDADKWTSTLSVLWDLFILCPINVNKLVTPTGRVNGVKRKSYFRWGISSVSTNGLKEMVFKWTFFNVNRLVRFTVSASNSCFINAASLFTVLVIQVCWAVSFAASPTKEPRESKTRGGKKSHRQWNS